MNRIRMRPIGLYWAGAVLFGLGVGARAQPVADLQPGFVSFGDVKIGEKLQGTFRIHNTGDKALEIYSIRPECTCTEVADVSPGMINPGGSRELAFTVMVEPPDVPGRVFQHINLETSDPVRGTITFTANFDVTSRHEVRPSLAPEFRVRKGGTDRLVVQVAPWEGAALLDAEISAPFSLEVSGDPARYDLWIVPPEVFPSGVHKGEIRLKFDSPLEPELRIPITMLWETETIVRPDEIRIATLGQAPAGKLMRSNRSFSERIRISRPGGRSVAISNLTVSRPDLIAVQVEQVPGAPVADLIITIQNRFPPGQPVREWILFDMDDPDRPQVRIPIYGGGAAFN